MKKPIPSLTYQHDWREQARRWATTPPWESRTEQELKAAPVLPASCAPRQSAKHNPTHFLAAENGSHDFSLACCRIDPGFERVESPPDNQGVWNRRVVDPQMRRPALAVGAKAGRTDQKVAAEQASAREKQAQTCVCKGLGACARLARNAKMEIVA